MSIFRAHFDRFPNARFALALGLALLLGACASTPEPPVVEPEIDDAGPLLSPGEQALQSLLDDAATSPSPRRERLLLQAGTLLRDMDRGDEALDLLAGIETATLPLALVTDISLLEAQLYISENRIQSALEVLTDEQLDDLPQLSDSRRIAVRFLRAQIYAANNRFLESARERIFADKLLPGNVIPLNHEQIWNALMALDAGELRTLADAERSFEFQGWYELGIVGKAYQYNLDLQLVELARWQQRWSRHPAARGLPRALQLVETLANERPSNLALLLPLDSIAGRVVRDGFLSAYYNVLEIGGRVPVVTVYDTSSNADILAVYRQAVAEGAEMVVGPLLKQHVARLHQQPSLPVPILALNNVENSTPVSNQLFQFALSPENEAVQIANKAWRDGHRYAAILSPANTGNDEFYMRKRNSFVDEWLSLGGFIVTQEQYRDDYTGSLAALLDISDSEARKEDLSDLIGRDLAFTQRRRQDIDFIFLIAEPGPARQINPTLAYLFAGDIPVYATQDVYSGIPRPLVDNDLNGVVFGDSPWLLNDTDELKPQTQTLFPQTSAQNLRLQAFGVDAFRLYPRLKQLENVPDSQIYGATGLLKMSENRNITRELSWAAVNNGLAMTIE